MTADHHACLAVVAGADERDDAGAEALLAVVGQRFRSLGETPLDRAADEADAGDRLGLAAGAGRRAATERQLLLRLGQLALELAALVEQRLDARRHVGRG